jgi:transposase-like protein
MAKTRELQPQSNVVTPDAPEGEESDSTSETSPTPSQKVKRYSVEEKKEILDFIDAHGRGGQEAAKKKFGCSIPAIGLWRKEAKKAAGGETAESKPSTPSAKSSASSPKVNMESVYKFLGGRGFKFSRVTEYGPTGSTTKDVGDPKLEALNLKEHTGSINQVEAAATSVVSTENKIVVAMPLETLLELMKIKP